MRCLSIVWVVVGMWGLQAAWADPPPAKPASTGLDLTADVQLIYRVVACGGTGPLPVALFKGDATREAKLKPIIERHCQDLAPYVEKFRTTFFDQARAWYLERLPKTLPSTIVYPFGGGDLISALVPFPDATEITTISLELAGDPRHLTELTPVELEKHLHSYRKGIGALILVGSNSSLNLSGQQRNAIPSQLSSHLLGLATAGYELVGARYFTLEDTGAIHYLEKAEIEADAKAGKSLRGNWKSPVFAQSFANVELQFKKPGDATVRTHRHIAWNLGDDYLKAHPAVLRHLEAKGKVTMMTKGASYLLWMRAFSTIRKYLLTNMAWMLSDSTGIPPTHARPAGLVQETFGHFEGPIVVEVEGTVEDTDTRALWKKSSRPAPFRFGYVDKNGHKHVLFTHPK
ncbi:MAG: hypothetical protein H0T79_00525 [Deltaproteobacteria bacterium]|nr:hypothetical protein [Deltaproteobacteria bacterium]